MAMGGQSHWLWASFQQAGCGGIHRGLHELGLHGNLKLSSGLAPHGETLQHQRRNGSRSGPTSGPRRKWARRCLTSGLVAPGGGG